MSEKKVILVLSVIFLLATTFQLYTSLQTPSSSGMTGAATTASVSFCYNNPPEITSIPNQTVNVSQLFTYQVIATDLNANSYLIYYDNTPLFDITSTGLINFTPQAADADNHSIEITVDDNSSCSNSEDIETFSLEIIGVDVPPEEPEEPEEDKGGEVITKPVILSLQLSQDILKVSLKQFQRLDKKIMVINNGTVDLNVEIDNPLSDVIRINPSTFNLPVNQTQELWLTFNYQKNASLGVHSGLVNLTGTYQSEQTSEELILVLEIESPDTLFDASLDLFKKSLFPDEELSATITVFNLRDTTPADVILTYIISDLKQSIIYEETETITLEEQVSFSKNIPLPPGIKPGPHLLALNVLHPPSFATTSELFTVKEPLLPEGPVIREPSFFMSILGVSLIILFILIVLLITIYVIRKKTNDPR